MDARTVSAPARVGHIAWMAAALLWTLASGQAFAQPSITVSFGRALNALTSTDTMTSDGPRATAGSIEAEQKLASERLRLFYTLDAGDYTTAGDWRYLQNDLGATWQLRKAATTGPSIFTGASGTWRSNGTSWAAADYRALGVFLNAQWTSHETRTIRAGYRADIRAFPDMPELDQVEHEGFGSFLVNLPSRTTLIAEVRPGAKRYDVLEPASLAAATTTGVPATLSQSGFSRGRGVGAQSQASGRVMSSAAYSATGSVGGTAGQVTVLGRIAQSLADRTGVTLQYMQRTSFGALPTAVVTTPALFFDDGVYDDPFASNARAVLWIRQAAVPERHDARGVRRIHAEGLPRNRRVRTRRPPACERRTPRRPDLARRCGVEAAGAARMGRPGWRPPGPGLSVHPTTVERCLLQLLVSWPRPRPERVLLTPFTLLFLGAIALHVYFNWRVILNYLRRKVGEGLHRRKEMGLAVAVGTAVLVLTIVGVPPFSTVMTIGEQVKNSWGDGEPARGRST